MLTATQLQGIGEIPCMSVDAPPIVCGKLNNQIPS